MLAFTYIFTYIHGLAFTGVLLSFLQFEGLQLMLLGTAPPIDERLQPASGTEDVKGVLCVIYAWAARFMAVSLKCDA